MTLRHEISDEALMVRFQRGDQGAFLTLVRRHKTPLYNFALRQLRMAHLAEDTVQDAFVRVVQNASDFKHDARFATWLYAITRNLCIDQLRKGAVRRHPSLDEPARANGDGAGDGDCGERASLGERTEDVRASVEREATAVELKERIASAVDHLPDEQREVFLMREIADLPFREIALVTGVSENTVKSRMRYALERLQAALSDYEEYARALR